MGRVRSPPPLRIIPFVENDLGAGTDLPWTGYDENMGGFTIEGKTPPPHEEFHARYHTASPDYFRAVGIPLVHGRFFNERDTKDTPRVSLINDVMARRYWPGEDAVEKRITFDDKPKESDWFRVVGVVGDVKDTPESKGAGILVAGFAAAISVREHDDCITR